MRRSVWGNGDLRHVQAEFNPALRLLSEPCQRNSSPPPLLQPYIYHRQYACSYSVTGPIQPFIDINGVILLQSIGVCAFQNTSCLFHPFHHDQRTVPFFTSFFCHSPFASFISCSCPLSAHPHLFYPCPMTRIANTIESSSDPTLVAVCFFPSGNQACAGHPCRVSACLTVMLRASIPFPYSLLYRTKTLHTLQDDYSLRMHKCPASLSVGSE